MNFGITVPNFGPFHHPRAMANLARQAEEAGWDGFFVWDHLLPMPIPVCDPWIALAAVAVNTEQIKLGPLVTPLPRRRPQKVARETVSLDQLSGGRLILGVGIGSGPSEWEYLGEEADQRKRGDMLDEALEILSKAWSGDQFSYNGTHYKIKGDLPGGRAQFLPKAVQEKIPIWVGGVWPNKRPFRRAAGYDGVIPIMSLMGDVPSPEELREILRYIKDHRTIETRFDVVICGRTADGADTEKVVSYERAGATWWLETIDPFSFGWKFEGEMPIEAMNARVSAGPPKVSR